MSIKNKIKPLIENDNRFDLLCQIFIIFSVVSFSIETLPNIGQKTIDFFNVAETIITIFFTIEYLLRLYVADKKMSYMFSFYGIVDLLAIAPFYIQLGVDMRSIRIFRMLRLIRLMKLYRYNKSMLKYIKTLKCIKEDMILFTIVTLMMLYMASVGIYYFEHEAQPEQFGSIFHCLWWSVATLTTVGYGDVYPITTGGKIFASFILIIGVGIVAIPAGLLASALSNYKEKDE